MIPLHIPVCESPCFLDSLVEMTKSLVPEDWELECLDGHLPNILGGEYIPVTRGLTLKMERS